MPAAVARERERFGAYRERTGGGGLLSDVLVEEVRRRERLVAIDDEAALICPWASRSPFELRVVPRREAASFADDEAGAAMLRTALRALAERFGGPPELNLWVRTAPRGAEHFHWHVDIAPRLTVKAGFELGTGVDINVYPPERAAADLREALAPSETRSAAFCLLCGPEPEAVPLVGCSVPPNPRPIPRFIADSTQEGIPTGASPSG